MKWNKDQAWLQIIFLPGKTGWVINSGDSTPKYTIDHNTYPQGRNLYNSTTVSIFLLYLVHPLTMSFTDFESTQPIYSEYLATLENNICASCLILRGVWFCKTPDINQSNSRHSKGFEIMIKINCGSIHFGLSYQKEKYNFTATWALGSLS